MISVQTNLSSLLAQENLRVNNEFQSKTIQRLTSGYRINQSGDDAAGLAVANGYRSSVTELTQGVRNANDGVSTLQIIDGGISNITKMLDRAKTLATESASGTFTGTRATLDAEYQDLLKEISRQAGNIGLSGLALATASDKVNATNLSVYIGGGSGATVSVDLSAGQVDAISLGLGVGATGKLDTAANATTEIGMINTALTSVGTIQGVVGSGQNKLFYATQLAQSQISSFSAAESRIRDADMAAEAANLTKAQVLQQASIAAMAQANSAPQSVLALLK
jgi:flagellin